VEECGGSGWFGIWLYLLQFFYLFWSFVKFLRIKDVSVDIATCNWQIIKIHTIKKSFLY
jgi:hypothetical protein